MVRADGGPDIGFGHLSRTSAIATEVLEHSGRVTYATTTPGPAKQVSPETTDVISIPSRTDPAPLIQQIQNERPDAVFVDSYPANVDYQQAVRREVPLAVLTDNTRHTICADLLTNGNLYADSLTYEFVGSSPRQLLGPEYVLLRQQIRTLATRTPLWREEPERAIVTMGGSDMTNQTPTVVRAFDGVDLHVDAVVGPGFSETQEQSVYAAAEAVSADVRVTRDPDDLAERMFQADFAVSTASSTTYELMALGTPIVSIPVVNNQEPIAAALRERDAATVLKRGAGKEALQRAIREYLSDASLRCERRELGHELVDGRGTGRVYTEILSLVKNS